MTLIRYDVSDTSGNNNGVLDPGETVDLAVLLKNIGGVDFTNLAATLICYDPYITVIDSSTYFGYLAVDSMKENGGDPYEIEVSASTPNGHSVELMLIAMDGSFVDTFTINLVVGGIDYLIWNPDLTPVSGQLINFILTGLGYSGIHTTMLPLSGLQTYKAIYVCAGIPSHNYVIGALSPEAAALVDYVNNGGCLYIEGGEVWYYDPTVGGYNFNSLFGINPIADGAGTVGPVVGQSGTFTQGMFFYYAGENYSIDQIEPIGSTAALIFYDNDNGYGCGVANDAPAYKTVGISFELGFLVDLGGVSTRAALLDSIMNFFGVSPTSVEEHEIHNTEITQLKISPNPFTQQADIRWQIRGETDGQQKTIVIIKIYDPMGRLVRSFSVLPSVIGHQSSVSWDGKDDNGRMVTNGVYFLRMKAGNWTASEKLLFVR